MTWYEAFWHVLGVLTQAGPAGLLWGAGAVTGVLLITALVVAVPARWHGDTPDARSTRLTVRVHARLTAVPRHRDPDAAGHARPRGPDPVRAAA